MSIGVTHTCATQTLRRIAFAKLNQRSKYPSSSAWHRLPGRGKDLKERGQLIVYKWFGLVVCTGSMTSRETIVTPNDRHGVTLKCCRNSEPTCGTDRLRFRKWENVRKKHWMELRFVPRLLIGPSDQVRPPPESDQRSHCCRSTLIR